MKLENSDILSFLFTGILGLAMYFMKLSHDQTKEQIVVQRSEIKELRDTSYRREDFKEFKEELFKRLDKIEGDLKSKT